MDDVTLDSLIENSLSDEDAPEQEDVVEELEDQEEDTSEVDEEDDDDDDSGPDDDDDAEDDSADDESGASDDEEVTPPSFENDPAFQQMQQQLYALQLQTQHYQALEQQRQQHAQQMEAQARLNELQARWETMEPEDAAREKLAFQQHNHSLIVQGLQHQNQELMARQQQAEEARAEEAAKPTAILKAIEYHGLSESDFDHLWLARSGDQLEEMALSLKAQRRAQTKSARKAKAQRLAQNPALVGSGGGRAASAARKEVGSLDDLIDNLWD